MILQEPVENLLLQIHNVIGRLSDEHYCQKLDVLSGASIGQHTRHILEFFNELGKGYAVGIVDYDQRVRNIQIETDRNFAISILYQIIQRIEMPDKELTLCIAYGTTDETPLAVPTSYYRELVYNLEHTVHHMAILRIGIRTVSAMAIPDDFGVAVSTLKYRAQCAR